MRKTPASALVDDPREDPSLVDATRRGARLDDACAWDPALAETLYDLLDTVDSTSLALDRGLESLRIKYHDLVYSELIYLLSHLRFEPDEARCHWERILEHRDRMRGAEGSPVDVRVALVSYFVEVNRKLQNPKIIEMKLFERTHACAYRDELTGLHNFRLFRDYLEQEVLRSRRYGMPLSLAMIDIDNFKTYNDTNGHEAGNGALVGVAEVLKLILRKADVAARYGGEEFALVLPVTTKKSALVVAERAREAIESYRFPNEGSQPGGRLTASIGVATFPADAADYGALVQNADRAMYVAKAQGKNQVQLYGKSQRSFRRVDTALDGEFRLLAPGSYPMTTVNVSEAGLLFATPRELKIGTLIDFELPAPDRDRMFRASGRVVHVKRSEDGFFRVAIRIAEMNNADRAVLAAYARSLSQDPDSDQD